MADFNVLADAQRNGLLNNEYWQKRLLKIIRIEAEEFIFQHLGKNTSVPRQMGTKTTSYRRYLRLPVDLLEQQLAEGVPPKALKVEGIKVSGTFQQYGAYIEITDVLQDIHFDDIRQVYQPELAAHAAEVRERVVMNSFSEASEVFVGGGTSADDITATDTLTLNVFREIQLSLQVSFRRRHKKYGRYLVATSPQAMQDLVDDDKLAQLLIEPGYGDQPIRKATLVNYVVYNLAFIETDILAEPTRNTADVGVYSSYVIADDAYAVINLEGRALSWHQTPFSAEKTDPLAQRATIGYKMYAGAKVLDPLAIYHVRSAVTRDVFLDPTDKYTKPADQT